MIITQLNSFHSYSDFFIFDFSLSRGTILTELNLEKGTPFAGGPSIFGLRMFNYSFSFC